MYIHDLCAPPPHIQQLLLSVLRTIMLIYHTQISACNQLLAEAVTEIVIIITISHA